MTARRVSNLTGQDLEEAREAGLRAQLLGLSGERCEAKLSGSPEAFLGFCIATGWTMEELDLEAPQRGEEPAFLSRRDFELERDER